MKKIFSLVILLGLFFHAFAQQKPLGRPLVSKIDEEIAPYITANGQTMVFMFKDSRKPDYIICYAEKRGKEWARPIEIGPANKLPKLLLKGSYCISEDGKTLYYTTKRHPSVGDYDIWMTTRNDSDVWSNPVNVTKPVNSGTADTYPSLSVDGSKLYFSRSISSGLRKEYGGCSKLMVAEKRGEGWGTPVEIKELNTGCEIAPKILADNETLIFASKRGGKSDFDLYISKKKINGKWGTPILFKPLQTPEDDVFCSFSAIQDIAYFSKSGGETQDLFMAKINEAIYQPHPINVFRYKLKANGIEDASIYIQDMKTGKTVLKDRLNTDSYVDAYLKTGTNYEVSIMERGRFLYMEYLDLEDEDRFNLFFNTVDLPKVKRGDEYPLTFKMVDKQINEERHLNELKRLAMIIDEYKGNVILQGTYQMDTTPVVPVKTDTMELPAEEIDATSLDSSAIEITEEFVEPQQSENESALEKIYKQLNRHLSDKEKFTYEMKEGMLDENETAPVLILRFE